MTFNKLLGFTLAVCVFQNLDAKPQFTFTTGQAPQLGRFQLQCTNGNCFGINAADGTFAISNGPRTIFPNPLPAPLPAPAPVPVPAPVPGSTATFSGTGQLLTNSFFPDPQPGFFPVAPAGCSNEAQRAILRQAFPGAFSGNGVQAFQTNCNGIGGVQSPTVIRIPMRVPRPRYNHHGSRNNLIVHRPGPLVVNRPPTHIVVKQPPMVVRQPPIVFQHSGPEREQGRCRPAAKPACRCRRPVEEVEDECDDECDCDN